MPFNLEVKLELVDFEPRQGSMYGGTLLKLYGWNFVKSERMEENVVRIGATIGEQASQICEVLKVERGGTTTIPATGGLPEKQYNSWLECRVPTDYTRTAHSAEVVVFASTFEEARSNETWNNGGHNFTFADPDVGPHNIPTITNVAANFDFTEEAWMVEVTTAA